jgi:hypothetical protein
MNHLRRTLGCQVVIVGLIVALMMSALPAPASAGHSWNNYHWGRTSNPFTVPLGDNVDATWDSYLLTTHADWSASVALDTVYVTGGTSPKRCAPTSGRVEVCNAKYGRTGWLGVAQIWISGGHITQGTAKLNDTYFNMNAYNTPGWRNLVMCQEVGHTFGLGHTDEVHSNVNEGTCMDYTNDPDGGPGGASETDPSNEHPNAHDYEQLDLYIYAHTDDTNTTGTSSGQTAGASGIEVPVPNGPEQGGVSVFVTPVEGGEVVTFVIWADANLIAAEQAAEQAPISDTTTDEEVIEVIEDAPVDNGAHFTEGSTVVTIDVVNLRAVPSRQGDLLQELPAGTVLTVIGPPEESQGLMWVPVTTVEGLSGYVAVDFIAAAESAT